jgi:hypothetical protein
LIGFIAAECTAALFVSALSKTSQTTTIGEEDSYEISMADSHDKVGDAGKNRFLAGSVCLTLLRTHVTQ